MTNTSLGALTQEHRERQKLFSLYWQYYRGQHRKYLKNPDGTDADDNVIVNLSRKVVDSSVDFLFGKDISFEVDGDEGSRSKEEEALATAWRDKPFQQFTKMDFLQGVAQNGGIFGTPFIRMHPLEDGNIRLVNLDPSLVDVVTDPNDKDRVDAYHIIWQVKKDWMRDRIWRLENGQWGIARQKFSGQQNGWMNTAEPVMWEYRWAPVFHCQNLKNTKGFWGLSDLEDADLNDAINFITSNTNRIIKYHAHPKTIGLGISAMQVESTAVDGFWAIPGAEEASVFNLEMSGNSLSNSRDQIADLKSAFHQVTGTPDLDPARVQVGALSGFALRILYGPLLSKTNSKRLRYGGMLARLNSAILELNGFDAGTEVSTSWQDPLPVHKIEQAQVYNTLVGGGADRLGAAIVAGYSREEAELLASAENEELTPES